MNGQTGTPAPDSQLTIWLEGIIGILLGMVGWMFRQARRSPRALAAYENGKRISRQDYISQLEEHIEKARGIMESAGPRLATVEETLRRLHEVQSRHDEQVERLEDEVTTVAEDVRGIRQSSLRVAALQRSQDENLRIIKVTLARIEGQFGA